MANKWIQCDSDEETARQLQKVLKIHPVFCDLLVSRGIETYDEAKAFFRPSLNDLIDPFLMKDMSEAVDRIHQAIQNQEKILIYGDYDVDGTTSVSLSYTFFSELTNLIDYYIPDRYGEGYGLSDQGVRWAKENGYQLIITLDCGITAMDEVETANELGIDIIIGDHHLPAGEIPKAVACLDPKRPDCEYPYKELSGAGVGFKICEAYAIRYDVDLSKVYDLLDLVSISIAADIVPITGENRIMAFYGLQKINENPRPGIKVIFDMLELDKEIDINDLVFTIGPRINAAGRMKHASLAVEVLIDKGSLDIDKKAQVLDTNNQDRRDVDKKITEEALAMINNSEVLKSNFSTVLYKNDWHKGVIGIVASRLIENFYRPTIVMSASNGLISGSARSVKGFSIYDALHECQDLLESFGGHKYAAGLSMKEENLPEFQNRFEQIVRRDIHEECMTPEIKIDAEIHLKEINDKFYNILKQFAPYGPGNMRPIFLIKNLQNAGRSKNLNNGHLKVNVRDPATNFYFDGIGFNLGNKMEIIRKGAFDSCFTLRENFWNGKRTIQMVIKDIREAEL